MTATEACEAMRAHHKALSEELAGRADAVSDAVAAGHPHGAAVARFISYLANEVLTHAVAEEKTIYPIAAARVSLADTVGEMITEHVDLSTAAARLATMTDATVAADQAQRIAGLFAAHAAKENDMLLPALVADQSVDLAGLLAQMHQHGAEGHADGGDPEYAASRTADAQAEVVWLLVQAAAALARAGEADRACRIAASAWAALMPARPDLAAKVAAALHGLARRTGGHGPDEMADGSGPTPIALPQRTGPDLDVRDFAPAQRHTRIFDAYRALRPGTGFVLVNDHDPKPLRYQFEAEHAGQFTWDYLEAGPEMWQVRIGRPGTGTGQDGEGAASEPDLDVRQVSHAERHGRIFDSYRALFPGAGFVLVSDHDPKPLRYQFEARYSGEHTWDYLEAGPKVWRVRIGRPAD